MGVVDFNMAAIIRSPSSLGRPSVICPYLWWCRHCWKKKGHEPYIYISLYMLHFCDVWCIMNFISRDQILTKSPGLVTFIIWSCDLHCIYIAQFCAFNARSCDLYRLILWLISPYLPDLVTYMYIALYCDLHVYRLILWPISPDLVLYITWPCDLYHPVWWLIYIVWTCELYHLLLWPISQILCPLTPDLVTFIIQSYVKYRPILNPYSSILCLYIAWSCDLHRPILWPISPDPVTYLAQFFTCILLDEVWSCHTYIILSFN